MRKGLKLILFLALHVALFSKPRSNKKALTILYTIRPLTEVIMVLFLRNKWFNVTLFLSDYLLRWWRILIEERACRKTPMVTVIIYWGLSALPPPVKTYSMLIPVYASVISLISLAVSLRKRLMHFLLIRINGEIITNKQLQ